MGDLGLDVQSWLAWNVLCRPFFTCLCLLRMRTTGVYHHTWLLVCFYQEHLSWIPGPDKTGAGTCLISLPLGGTS